MFILHYACLETILKVYCFIKETNLLKKDFNLVYYKDYQYQRTWKRIWNLILHRINFMWPADEFIYRCAGRTILVDKGGSDYSASPEEEKVVRIISQRSYVFVLLCQSIITHNFMQQLWKEWLHSPQITTHSSCSLSLRFSAWQRKQASKEKNIY